MKYLNNIKQLKSLTDIDEDLEPLTNLNPEKTDHKSKLNRLIML